ncbi:unnamed protein product [Ambrosiozyma monospora]|uniref:Unnamed protein product n=1 Tax=Ambrosiozyma monospora TaxID=43982 RepID=A0ACB5SUK4_AMBMO|nr:unnamed protein product [Ambrosiozyma monospora]
MTKTPKTRACDKCRSRKIKCVSISPTECKACLKDKVKCTFKPTSTKMKSTKSESRKSDSKNGASGKRLIWKKSMTVESGTRQLVNLPHPSFIQQKMNNVFVNDGLSHQRISKSESPKTSVIQFDESVTPESNSVTPQPAQQQPGQPQSRDESSTQSPPMLDGVLIRTLIDPKFVEDLPPSKADEFHQFFFEELGFLSDIIFSPKFFDNYKTKNFLPTKCLAYIIWAIVLVTRQELELAERYAKKSEALLRELLESSELGLKMYNSITTCQTFALIGDYAFRRGRTLKSSMILAECIRICQLREYDSLDMKHPFGLSVHEGNRDSFLQETKDYPSWVLLEEQRRTFFRIFCFDKYSGLGRNLRPILEPELIKTRVPSAINIEYFHHLGEVHIPDFINYKESNCPMLMEGVEAISRGEILYNVSPFGIHVILLTVVHEILCWTHEICSPDVEINEQMIATMVSHMNQFYFKLDFLGNTFTGYCWENLNSNMIMIGIAKMRILHTVISIFTRVLQNSPQMFDSNMDTVYFEAQTSCTQITLDLIKLLIDCGKLPELLVKNPFYHMTTHHVIKSVIQLAIISNQPNCKHVDKRYISEMFAELSKMVATFEAMQDKVHLLSHLINFYNSKLKTFESNPYESIFFQDQLQV